MANKNLNAAKAAKKDEFYTQLEDINNELRHYREHFREKLCSATATTHVLAISSLILLTTSSFWV